MNAHIRLRRLFEKESGNRFTRENLDEYALWLETKYFESYSWQLIDGEFSVEPNQGTIESNYETAVKAPPYKIEHS